MDSFYLVWRQAGGLPNHRHESLSEAQDEAKRIAEKHLDEVFVLKAIERYVGHAQVIIEDERLT